MNSSQCDCQGAVYRCGEMTPLALGAYVCTRPEGHTGPHRACQTSDNPEFARHDLDSWPNEPVPSRCVHVYKYVDGVNDYCVKCGAGLPERPEETELRIEARIAALERQIRELNPGLR